MDWPSVTVCIAAYNAEDTISDLIDTLLELSYQDYEVIVVDDGSTDSTADIVNEYTGEGSPVTLIQQENKGASAARNRAFEAAESEIVAYTDSDTRVEADWLNHLVEPFEEPIVGATTGRTIFETNESCTSWVRSTDIDIRNENRRRTTRLANGPNSAFRRELLADIGGFDPEWFHAEDTAVSYEVYEHGFEIRYVPEAIVYHVPESEWRDYLRKRYRDAKAFTRVLFTHPTSAAVEDDFVPLSWKVQPVLFGGLLIGLPFSLILGPIWTVSWLVILGFGVVMNVPFSAEVARRARKPTFFFKSLGLTVSRGIAWGLGLIVGGTIHGIRYLPRTVRG